ncbi:LolA family protein [Palleronia caenipelagi]|uniref:Outer membrane lipoprotein carrier protein LolA n=1 Tax=Palleronia caenipelagi TaxID=2489174 RepID=A0A547Q0B5_9RHOB|nr:outer membrane lipoprotein carrier protein LolA [Palleronia caenipelagi]TRD19851.1 outer membrane lipoprotein carrier protein LolA [Palleronia caenipelagi]
MLDRRTFLMAAGATALTAGRASAATIPLNQLSGYLNSLTTAQADFTQINSDGTIATGTLYIHRPGRLRFDYNKPTDMLVMAGGGQVAIFDSGSNSKRPEQYPLNQTPLSIILASNVNLGQAGMVVGHRQDGNKTIVTAQDPQRPQYGKLEMVFTGGPVQLRQWVVIDGQGQRTTTVLGDLRKVGSLPSRYFSIPTEIQKRS